MNTDEFKMSVKNRGWISTKFSVKNPVSHFLNIYKKNSIHHKKQSSKDSFLHFPEEQTFKKHDKKGSLTQVIVFDQTAVSKPKTAPHNLILNENRNIVPKQSIKTLLPKRSQTLYANKKYSHKSTLNQKQHTSFIERSSSPQIHRYQERSSKDFKATNCGRFKPQLMFLKPQMRNSMSNIKHIGNQNTNDALERRKSYIYRQISKSTLINKQLTSNLHNKKSISHYQQIQYMTEYSEPNEEKILYLKKESQQRKAPRTAGSLRRKGNIAVLRDKLKYHYNKSDYRQKISSVRMEPETYKIDAHQAGQFR